MYVFILPPGETDSMDLPVKTGLVIYAFNE